MPLLTRVLVTLENESGLAADAVTNTWHFDADDGEGEVDDLVDRLQLFYEAIDGFLSRALSGVIKYKVYNMADAIPRTPIYEREDTLTIPNIAALPNEVAVCLSYRAAYVSGEPNARRRGRIYIGPLSLEGATSADGPDIRVTVSLQQALCTAATALLETPDPGDSRWAVYSPTTDVTETLADAYNDVVGGWVDNAFDTVRSRGVDATSRRLFPDA